MWRPLNRSHGNICCNVAVEPIAVIAVEVSQNEKCCIQCMYKECCNYGSVRIVILKVLDLVLPAAEYINSLELQ